MQTLRFLFSPSGRLGPQAFIASVLVVYLAGAASHLLTRPEIAARGGLWWFGAIQAALIWIWFVLHVKRLHDAGRNSGVAVGAGIVYALSIVLLLILIASFHSALAGQASDANAASALGLILFVSIVAILLASSHHDSAWLVVAILLAISFLPMIVTVSVTLWAATGPRAEVA
jgi:uncharacterized membrane protein YhaH (DUF805 family)